MTPREEYENSMKKVVSLTGAIKPMQKYIEALEATIEAQDIIIKDKTAIMEAMAQPKRCFDCKDKYGCYSFKCLTEDQTYMMSCPMFEPKA